MENYRATPSAADPWTLEGSEMHQEKLRAKQPKQQGPEGRTGPAGRGPQCLTLLSEPTRKLAL